MTDAILGDNHRKSELSFAYLAALSAIAGYTCQRGPQPDVDSIDATVRAGGSMRPQIDVQLKATSSPSRLADGLHFQLGRKNYEDLRTPRLCPAILVVLELPTPPAEWFDCSADRLILRRCAWWQSLSEYPEADSDSKVVVIPESQRLDLYAMIRLMGLARHGAPLE